MPGGGCEVAEGVRDCPVERSGGEAAPGEDVVPEVVAGDAAAVSINVDLEGGGPRRGPAIHHRRVHGHHYRPGQP